MKLLSDLQSNVVPHLASSYFHDYKSFDIHFCTLGESNIDDEELQNNNDCFSDNRNIIVAGDKGPVYDPLWMNLITYLKIS
jgi:hypothetical protein